MKDKANERAAESGEYLAQGETQDLHIYYEVLLIATGFVAGVIVGLSAGWLR